MQDLMQNHTNTALFNNASEVVGGVGKAISTRPLLLAITLPGLSVLIITLRYPLRVGKKKWPFCQIDRF